MSEYRHRNGPVWDEYDAMANVVDMLHATRSIEEVLDDLVLLRLGELAEADEGELLHGRNGREEGRRRGALRLRQRHPDGRRHAPAAQVVPAAVRAALGVHGAEAHLALLDDRVRAVLQQHNHAIHGEP